MCKLIFSTVPNSTEAEKIARALLEKKLVACVSMTPEIRSLYWWKGAIEDTSEVLLIMKTVSAKIPELISEIKKVHSYEVPEIIVVPIESGLPEYCKWIKDTVGVS